MTARHRVLFTATLSAVIVIFIVWPIADPDAGVALDVATVLTSGLALVAGLVALTKRRVPPWLGNQPEHPRGWGLAFAIFGLNGCTLGIWPNPHPSPFLANLRFALTLTGFLLLLLSSVPLWRKRPQRNPADHDATPEA